MYFDKIVLFSLSVILISNTAVAVEFTFRNELYKYVEESAKQISAESNICKVDHEVFCNACKKAVDFINLPRAIVYVGSEIPMKGMKTYRLANQMFGNPKFVSACNCPTDALMFLRDGDKENELIITRIKGSRVSASHRHLIPKTPLYYRNSGPSYGETSTFDVYAPSYYTPGPLSTFSTFGGGLLFRPSAYIVLALTVYVDSLHV